MLPIVDWSHSVETNLDSPIHARVHAVVDDRKVCKTVKKNRRSHQVELKMKLNDIIHSYPNNTIIGITYSRIMKRGGKIMQEKIRLYSSCCGLRGRLNDPIYLQNCLPQLMFTN